MKTLIINGSPRKNGDTKSLINLLTSKLDGEYKIVDTYFCGVKPCIDCRYCWKNPTCCMNDGWQEIADYIKECDNIVIASPVYFGELTGSLLSLMSRMQMYFAAQLFRKEKSPLKPKRGGTVLVGGGSGAPDAALITSAKLLKYMKAAELFDPVCCLTTDKCSAADDRQAAADIERLAEFLNENKAE